MRPVHARPPLLHILVCVNHRDDDRMPCCGANRGEEVWEAMREAVRVRGLLGQVWVTRTGCLGWCHREGATVALYPPSTFYREVTPEHVPELLERHLRG